MNSAGVYPPRKDGAGHKAPRYENGGTEVFFKM